MRRAPRADRRHLPSCLPTAGRLRRSVVDSLQLRSHGLELVRPDVRMLALRDGGDPLAFWADAGRTAEAL